MCMRYWAALLAMMLILSGCGKGDVTDSGTETDPTSEELAEDLFDNEEADQGFDEDVFADDEPPPAEEPSGAESGSVAAGVPAEAQTILSKEEVQAIAKGRFDRAWEKIEPFDRDQATRKLMLEEYRLNMDEFPEKPLSPAELRSLFMSGLKLRADEAFPAADREHVAKQAMEQFPMYKKGDHVKLGLARGIVEGTIELISIERIKVDGRYVLVRDIRSPPPEAFDEPRIEKRRAHYISLNYEQPRQTLIAKLDEKERQAFYERHFYIKGASGWFRADQVFKRLRAKEGAKLERLYMDEQRFNVRQKIEQELRAEGLWQN